MGDDNSFVWDHVSPVGRTPGQYHFRDMSFPNVDVTN